MARPLIRYRQRLLFRGVFLLLALSTLALALVLLSGEKERSYHNYRQNFQKTHAELMARLRHPTGRLMLLNPQHRSENPLPVRPMLLPYAALDFSDRSKSQQAVEMSGCLLQYADGAAFCAAIGHNPYAGGFIYLVGSFASDPLEGRKVGQLDLRQVHRLRIELEDPDQNRTYWLAPFETTAQVDSRNVWGRLPGYASDNTMLQLGSRPDRDFRGWIWQDGQCINNAMTHDDCQKRTFFSIRMPVERFQEALFQPGAPQWPPANLNDYRIRIQAYAPDSAARTGSQTLLFDSNQGPVQAVPSLNELGQILAPGEMLRVSSTLQPEETLVRSAEQPGEAAPDWIRTLLAWLPGKHYPDSIELSDSIVTPLGSYQITLEGNIHSVEQHLALVVSRVSWYILAMLVAIMLAWLAIELNLMRRVVRLTRRAVKIQDMQEGSVAEVVSLDFNDLRGRDEVGILAAAMADLLQRVRDDLHREQIRAQQERNMWHAVGHEIMSPLQSLMVLHDRESDASYRYVQRMQQAIQVLYGRASPSEAFQEATLQLDLLELNAFLQTLADNAPFAGIENVRFTPADQPVMARADEFSLEDVLTHILRNADRHRSDGAPIDISLDVTASTVHIRLHNQGPGIDPAVIDNIFEYGVSGPESHENEGQRGQGLFVAKTYMAKMGGTIRAINEQDGVSFILSLQRQ